MYALVSTFNRTFDDYGILYFIPEFLISKIKVWQIVEVPLGTKIDIWIVLKIWELNKINKYNIPKEKIKSLIWIKNKNIFLDKNQIKLAFFVSEHYFSQIHNSILLFFPKNLRDKIKKDKINLENNKNYKYDFNFNKKLSFSQEKIFEEIKKSWNKKFLLYWVTWSWKTEIYIKLIKENLKKNKQSLLLIPEIILANQLEKRLKEVFWEEILVVNSSITEANKTKAWIWVYNNTAKIIIWTRSALFLPYKDLWLIIIDEEHDSSYISDKSPRYNSIEVAYYMSDIYNSKLVLASWTPLITTMYDALNWKYKLLNLLKKYNKKAF